ncbi:hypothetical protein DASC09_015720 [Saccharomycopsis crataegensis]|uniref:Altered inheritance of mitochondria protein 44 n=1 Tax=Saccharomycopsis crataegensis TaxID=43959 RepID=A0AAV5QI41_9ASCO|nr:hypothetical protein DASC09_015720 [Saccharomycopsis crataegensis]
MALRLSKVSYTQYLDSKANNAPSDGLTASSRTDDSSLVRASSSNYSENSGAYAPRNYTRKVPSSFSTSTSASHSYSTYNSYSVDFDSAPHHDQQEYYNSGSNLSTPLKSIPESPGTLSHYNNAVVVPRPTKSSNIVIKQINPVNFGTGFSRSTTNTGSHANTIGTIPTANNSTIISADTGKKTDIETPMPVEIHNRSINSRMTVTDYHPTGVSPTSSAGNSYVKPASSLRRSSATRRTPGWKRRFMSVSKKFRLKFRSFRQLIAKRTKNRKLNANKKSVKRVGSLKNSDKSSTSDILSTDQSLLQKYVEKKRTRRQRSVGSLRKKISLIGNKRQLNDELNVLPPITNFSKNKRDFSNSSQLTVQNVEKLLNLPSYQPIKKDIIEKYVTDVSEEIQNNYLKADTSDVSQDTVAFTVDAKDVRRSSVQIRPTATIAKSMKNKSFDSMKTNVNDQLTTSRGNTISSRASSKTEIDPAYEEFVDSWSSYLKNVIAQRALSKIEAAQNAAATTPTDTSIGYYSTDVESCTIDNTAAQNTSVRRLSVLDAILDNYSNDGMSEKGDSDIDTITEEDRNNDGDAESFASSNTACSPFPASVETFEKEKGVKVGDKEFLVATDSAVNPASDAPPATEFPVATEEGKPSVVLIERVHSNGSISSHSTIDSAGSLKTSNVSDNKTQYYSISDSHENIKDQVLLNEGIAVVTSAEEEAEQDSRDFIHDFALSRSGTVVIKHDYHDANDLNSQKFLGNTKSILDILAIPETSISDIDENFDISNKNLELIRKDHYNNGKKITVFNKAMSEISRSTSLASSVAPLNVNHNGKAPKKYCSMNDINGMKLENNLKSFAAITTTSTTGNKANNTNLNRPLSMRYNRKSNNAAIIRFLSQQRYQQEQAIVELH